MDASEKDAVGLSSNLLCDVLRIFHGAVQDVHHHNRFGYAFIETIKGNESDECDEAIEDKVIACIRDIVKRGFSYGDIALLVRSNSDVASLTGVLLTRDIDVVSDKTLSLKENIHINEIISFLNFLNSPIDDCSFASFILGDIFLKATRLSREEIEQFLFTLHTQQKEGAAPYFYTAFRSQFHNVWETYIEKEFFKKVGIFPVYEFVRHIFEIYNIFDHFPSHHAFFMRFLEFIKESEDEHTSLSSFLNYISTLPVDDILNAIVLFD